METRITKILVGFDHSAASNVALEKAILIAQKFGSAIHVVYAEGGGHFLDWDSVHDYLDDLRSKTGIAFHIHHQHGRAFKEIVHVERDIHADLIVLGTHSHSGFIQSWIGSTAYRVVSSSRCPVITVQESSKASSFNNLIVPIVDSAESRQKLGPAAAFAEKFGSTAHVICLSKAKDAQTEHDLLVYAKQAVDFFKSRDIPHTVEARIGVNVAQTVIDYSAEKNGGLILMMTEKETGGTFMGNVAQQLINNSPVPVMAIHNVHLEGMAGTGY